MCPFPMFFLFSDWNRDSFVFTAAMRNRSIYQNQLFLPENTAEIERSRVLKIFPFSPSPQMSVWKSATPDKKMGKELGLVLGPAAYCRLWSVPGGRTLGRRLPGLIHRPAGQVPTQTPGAGENVFSGKILSSEDTCMGKLTPPNLKELIDSEEELSMAAWLADVDHTLMHIVWLEFVYFR